MNEMYWFRLDCNFYNDPKIQDILFSIGAEGVAAYIITVAMLYSQKGKLRRDRYGHIAYAAHTTEAIVKRVIEDFGLFSLNDNEFWSERAVNEISFAEQRASRNRTNGIKGGRPRKNPEDNPNETQEKPNKNPVGFQNETQTKPRNNHNTNTEQNNNTIDIYISPLSKDKELCPTPAESDPKSEILSNKHCQQVLDFWNRSIKATASDFPEVKLLTEKRKSKIRTRWKEFAKLGDPVDICRTIIEKACASKFMQGDNPRGWKACFDWIFDTEKNWAKVYEGNYDNKGEQRKPQTLDDMYREQIEKMRSKYGTDKGYTDIPEEQ